MSQKYTCQKCGRHEYSEDEVRMSGGFWSSAFNLENKKFITIECENCGYTEFFKKSISTSQKIADLFLG